MVYEHQIVGRDSVPPSKYLNHWQESFKRAEEKLKQGLTLRYIVPKGKSTAVIWSAWDRYCRKLGKKPFYQQEKQADGSILVWLWYEEKK